jgi:diguanylate cyclase (GGDEF)-like protein
MSLQREMLTQRIAHLGQTLVMPPAQQSEVDTLESMILAIQQLQKAELTLTDMSGAQGVAGPASAALHQIYFDRPYDLHQQVTNFLDHARNLSATAAEPRTPLNPDYLALEKDADGPLLAAENAVKTQYQLENDASVSSRHHLLTALFLLMYCTLAIEAFFVFRPLFRKLAHTHGSLLHAALTDPLTGCPNRRAFTEEANREFARTLRFGSTFALIVLDIDNFKEINDSYGHAAGDNAIVSIVSVLLSHLRQTEMLGRMGGDEFCILLPQTNVDKAALAAERLRQAVATSKVRSGQKNFSVTISMGVSMCHTTDTGLFDSYNRADHALYRAKQNGRNSIAVENEEDAEAQMAQPPGQLAGHSGR